MRVIYIVVMCGLLNACSNTFLTKESVELQKKGQPNFLDVKQSFSHEAESNQEYVLCDVEKGAWKCPSYPEKKKLLPISNQLVEQRKKHFSNRDEVEKSFGVEGLVGDGLGVVHFDFDSYGLGRKEISYLLSEVYQKINGRSVLLFGYTDNVGSEQYNDKLALRRAVAVKEFLVERGIPENLISVKGSGACCYLVPNGTEQQRRINRRTEIYLAR